MTTQSLLREWQLTPQKELGQNFLVDRGVLAHILAAAEISATDMVLEIGPGLGTLTQALAEHAQRVVAVELDQKLVAILHDRLQVCSNVQIVAGDILALDIAELLTAEPASGPAGCVYKVVANIPYNITSAVLRHLLEASIRPQLIVLMVQKEVAQRITARPGDMSLLSVSVQFYGRPRVIRRVPAAAFYPVPKVDSAIIRIDPHPHLPLEPAEIEPFFAVVRAGFGQRRKQLHNSLVHGLGLPAESIVEALAQAGVDGERRAQTLGVGEWVGLYRALRGVAAGASSPHFAGRQTPPSDRTDPS
jgi:16S rRNA (adenine1518-N6/adenine1519-N6)-dimethyltransferase